MVAPSTKAKINHLMILTTQLLETYFVRQAQETPDSCPYCYPDRKPPVICHTHQILALNSEIREDLDIDEYPVGEPECCPAT